MKIPCNEWAFLSMATSVMVIKDPRAVLQQTGDLDLFLGGASTDLLQEPRGWELKCRIGAKSYIDEASQSPSFPPISPTSPKMDTSSLTKEVNVMSQAELDKLGSTYSFSSGIQLRIPGDGETILSARQGEVAFYEAAFLAGLRFPIHPTIREILVHYKICPAQLSPNAWRSVICSLVIWRHFKRHMTCDEFRCLYSLSPLPDSGWYYFKARPKKNLFRGSPSNVKGWKTRFFFASEDEWEFPSGVVASDIATRVPRSWGTPEDGGDPREDRARRLLRGFEGPGFTDLQQTLCGWLHGALYQWRGQHDLGVTRGEGKGPVYESPIWDVRLQFGFRVGFHFGFRAAPELRSDAMSARGKAKAEKATKTTAKPPTKGVVICEKRTREGDPLIEIGEPDASKGKEAMPPPPPKRFKSNRGAINARGRAAEAGTSIPGGDMGSESMSDASVARRLLTGVIPASDKKEVDQLSENEWSCSPRPLPSAARSICMDSAELELVKAQNRAVKAENRLAELNEEGSEAGTKVDDLKATVAELTNKLAKAKELAIEDFKASGEFKAAVIDSAATYFSEGFEFCKRQLLHQYPNLGVDVANMAMDPSFTEEEEARKEGEDPAAGVAPDV
ncbi:hypothetical protein Acr_15g0009720 [Actinidia rufa]|uniref:Transposase (putative) gypsy type domain-containing protein n=1 Tax=Actinidia rufa TaxID=165716 RepID=A0A7J0FUW5_9ERIC|nr:hypothetical protein Acr_15g0009720 [Actinidia rufa]